MTVIACVASGAARAMDKWPTVAPSKAARKTAKASDAYDGEDMDGDEAHV